MKNQPADRFDERIDRMTAALRHEPMPAPPANFRWSGPARPHSWTRICIVTGTVAACAAFAFLAMAPEESAASMLQRLLKAGEDIPVQTLLYDIDAKGDLKLRMEAYVYRDKARLEYPDSRATFIVGDRQYDFDRIRNFAVMKRGKPRSGEALFYDNSLKRFLDMRRVASVKRTPDVEWRGMRLDRFDIRDQITDALGQKLEAVETLYADIKTDRPYFLVGFVKGGAQGQFVQGERTACEWRYPAASEVDFASHIPPSAPIYDEAAMREKVKEQVTGNLGEDTVDGITVILRAVYANEYGGLEVFTTGGTGRIERSPQGLRINGKETEGAHSAGQNHGHWAGGDYRHGGLFVFEPLDYRGLKLIYQEAGWMEVQVPPVIDLEVPVWKSDNSRYSRHFAGYAKFEHVVPTRYAGQILDGERTNVSVLWSEKDVEIENRRWKELRKQSSQRQAKGKA